MDFLNKDPFSGVRLFAARGFAVCCLRDVNCLPGWTVVNCEGIDITLFAVRWKGWNLYYDTLIVKQKCEIVLEECVDGIFIVISGLL